MQSRQLIAQIEYEIEGEKTGTKLQHFPIEAQFLPQVLGTNSIRTPLPYTPSQGTFPRCGGFLTVSSLGSLIGLNLDQKYNGCYSI